MNPVNQSSCADRGIAARGFTLIEVLVTLVVLGVIMTTLMLVLQSASISRTRTTNILEARQKASTAMGRLCKDLRMSGTGVDVGYATPQPAIAYIDSMEVIIAGDFSGSKLAPSDTLAYDPAGDPKPCKLTGAYAPPIKYRTGAELVRWTLDVNNDGLVDTADRSDVNSVAARRTRNPNDYVLVRQIYGDSLNNIARDNGGTIGWIAPVRKPGGVIPPFFIVTMKNGTIWNWSSGPVPAAQLGNIRNVQVQVTGESAKPDARGQYAQVAYSTRVNVSRISP